MKKTTVVLSEVGIIAGIVAAALMLPPSTPLISFEVVAAIVFVTGNALLFASTRKPNSSKANARFWPQILKGLWPIVCRLALFSYRKAVGLAEDSFRKWTLHAILYRGLVGKPLEQ